MSGCYRKRNKIDGTVEKKLKVTGSKKCGCPFTLTRRVGGGNDIWMLLIACGVHN